MSFDNRHKSLIDHIIVSQELSCYIKYCKILDDNSINVSSHRPIVFNIQITLYEYISQNPVLTVKWHTVSHEQLYNYESDLSRYLKVSIDNIYLSMKYTVLLINYTNALLLALMKYPPRIFRTPVIALILNLCKIF